MGFKRGHKLSPGRPPGSKNKNTDLMAKCLAHGIDVFEEMLSIAMTTNDPSARFNMFRDISALLYPKKKEVMNLDSHSADELLEVAEKKLAEIESIDDEQPSET